jgi:uncharacterized protein YjdB
MRAGTTIQRLKVVLFLGILGILLLPQIQCNAETITTAALENSQKLEAEEQESTQAQVETNTPEVQPTELDLGDYLTEMNIGDKQLLAVTILPSNATIQELKYSSSNTKVATINGLGRITAEKEGKTKITVVCGEVSASFDLTVKKPESSEVAVTELDLGDCPKEITIGTSQLLSVAVIPANATNTTFTYESANPAVASVNALGRLTGNQLGTTEITVICGKVKGKFSVTVVEDNSEQTVEVTDIEIGDYEEELKVDSTMNLSVTVLPSNATEATVTYQSSNPEIATVNSSGEVKGIAPGQLIIYVSAGTITKQVPITVKIGTTAIELNSNYQVMKPGATFQIKAEVKPAGAAGGITYKSMDSQIASVSASGVITAKSCGNTSVIVSNGDMQVSVTVIVNEEGISTENEEVELPKENDKSIDFPEEVNAEDYSVISKEMLKYFYENKKVLTIKGDGYTMYIDGKDIVNYENELETELLFQEETEGFTLTINQGKKLCGKITIDISEKVTKEKYLYLYSSEKERYQELETENIGTLKIDTPGKYLLTARQLSGMKVSIVFIAIGSVAVLIGVVVYVGVKKQYWFW